MTLTDYEGVFRPDPFAAFPEGRSPVIVDQFTAHGFDAATMTGRGGSLELTCERWRRGGWTQREYSFRAFAVASLQRAWFSQNVRTMHLDRGDRLHVLWADRPALDRHGPIVRMDWYIHSTFLAVSHHVAKEWWKHPPETLRFV